MKKINLIPVRLVITFLICALVFFAGGHLEAQTDAYSGEDTGSVSDTSARDYLGVKDGMRYDIAFKQAPLREAVQFLAAIADMNVIMPEDAEGDVNVNFRDLDISDAINAIIKSNGLEYTVEGRVIRVGKGDAFKESGEDLKSETIRLRYATAKDTAEQVKKLLSSRGSVIDDARTNSIVVREMPTNIDNVRRFVTDIDIKDAQVLIESKILEATRNFSRDIGIQWGVTRGGGTSALSVAGINAVGQADSGRNLDVNLPASNPTSGLLLGSFFKGTNLDIQITAAERRGDIYVVSDPSIVTSNGRPARIRSGAKFYIQGSSTVNIGTTAGTAASSGTGIQEVNTGIELKVTPQITIDNYVKLNIEATTSVPDFTRAVQGIPVIMDNVATTVVLVKDGETTVIGGLSRYSDTETKKKVPYFSEIPLLGNLFKSKSRAKENSELMVFLKPTIVRTEGQMPAQIREREVEERRAMMALTPLEDPNAAAIKEEKMQEIRTKRKGNRYLRMSGGQ